MSYRALVSIIDPANQHDYCLHLDEQFKDGEELSEALASMGSLSTAKDQAHNFHFHVQSRHFDTPEGRQQWIGTYADQTWAIVFTPEGEGVNKVEVTGKNAMGEMIFYRAVRRIAR